MGHESDLNDLTSRPIWQIIDCGLILIAFAATYKLSTGDSVYSPLGLVLLSICLWAAWQLGRLRQVRSLLAGILIDNLIEEPTGSVIESNNNSIPRIRSKDPWRSRLRHLIWWIGGFVFVAGCLGFLELREPYYFSQDDNLSQFLPTVLHGCRSLFDEGVFSTWNPYQFMGSPTASLGTYALTYPPTYAAYGLARFGLRNEYATLEVFCILHLLAAYAATFWACRVLRIRPSLAAATGVCFAVSGYFLIVGRSWYYMCPTAVWAPLLIGLIEQFRRGSVTGRWILKTAIVFGIFFHAGNAQMWLYAGVFFVLAIGIVLYSSSAPWSRALAPAAALFLGIGIASPLLVPQYIETSNVKRHRSDLGILQSLPSILLPYPIFKTTFPTVRETKDADRVGQLYYSGTILTFMAALGMCSLLVHRWPRKCISSNIWLVLAWIATLFAIGYLSPLWQFAALIPPFNAMKHPFKFVAFITLFMLVGGAVLTERLLRRKSYGSQIELCIVLAIGGLVSYHICMSTTVICKIGFHPPDQLPLAIQALRQQQPQARIFPVAALRCQAPEYALSMMHQAPTIWKWPALLGYDPLVSDSAHFEPVLRNIFQQRLQEEDINRPALFNIAQARNAQPYASNVELASHYSPSSNSARRQKPLPQSLVALQAYGVRWVIIYTGRAIPDAEQRDHPLWDIRPEVEQIGQDAKVWGREVVHRSDVCIYELDKPSPLAFAHPNTDQALPSEISDSGMIVDTSALPQGGKVTVNVVKTPFLTATTNDGTLINADCDEWGRLQFSLPAGIKKLQLAYRPPWLLGLGLGVLWAGVAALTIALRLSLLKRGA